MPTVDEPETELPELRLEAGYPRDLLSYVGALPAFLMLGCTAAVFTGLAAGVLATPCLIVSTSSGVGYVLVCGTAVLLTLWIWARHHFGISQESLEFYADRLVAVVKRPGVGGNYDRLTIPYDQIGSLRVPRFGTILRVRFRPPAEGVTTEVTARIPKLISTDLLDRVQELIVTTSPHHLFSTEILEKVESSVPWSPGRLGSPGGLGSADRLLSPGRDRPPAESSSPEEPESAENPTTTSRKVEGKVVLTRSDSMAKLLDQSWEIQLTAPHQVTTTRIETDQLDVAKQVYLSTEFDFDENKMRVYGPKGLLVAWYLHSITDSCARLQCGWGPLIFFDIVTRTIRINDRTCGTLQDHGDELVLDLAESLDELTVLILFAMAQSLPVRRPLQSSGAA